MPFPVRFVLGFGHFGDPLASLPLFLVYTIINDSRKLKKLEKRAYSGHPKAMSTPQELINTAVQLSYSYNFQSNQGTIVVDNLIFLTTFIIPSHLAYTPICTSQACHSDLINKVQQRIKAEITKIIVFTFTDDNGRLFTFQAGLLFVCK
ncbi:unnamed protein product [Didymodactylos carnosus]|uniref:Uncharacterized protein n=1 Tax=Didymodactylos carnosus TaxID=1234261 RepID=A0A8S2E5Q3_9BILA|nr:unnamed protein product [Didymodactylos carnosus]CAF3821867.1 unnamed protein product [Didymodactylos carnosus]